MKFPRQAIFQITVIEIKIYIDRLHLEVPEGIEDIFSDLAVRKHGYSIENIPNQPENLKVLKFIFN